MGIKKKPGPYKMSQEHLLPKFGSGSKPGIAGALSDAELDVDLPNGAIPHPSEALAGNAIEALSAPGGTFGRGSSSTRLFIAKLSARFNSWIRPRRTGPLLPCAGGRHVQAELSLDGLRVVRNDLSDSDFVVMPARKKVSAAEGRNKGDSQRQALGVVWNRLSARLLRQAVQEFNVVQKERGKLLSQAGDGHGSTGGS
jgi:hypothetical protein